MLLVATTAPCIAFYAFVAEATWLAWSPNPPSTFVRAGILVLAAVLPTLWIGAARRTPPDGLFIRFIAGAALLVVWARAIGPLRLVAVPLRDSALFVVLAGALARAMGPFLIVVLIEAPLLIVSLVWYTARLNSDNSEQPPIEGKSIETAYFIMQMLLSSILFMAALAFLHGIT
jgi:hypothetical protein